MQANAEQAEKLRAAQEYFRSLEVKGWKETNSPVQEGGQATILVVERGDGSKGAFRYTKETEEKALERFSREINILSEYHHTNILKILAHSENRNQPWYISEFGRPFSGFWKRRRAELEDDPEQLVAEAVAVLRKLADGLGGLHDRGVVHRDIKPSNMIVIGESDSREPLLIDFGLAHLESEPRLSDVNETVGNVRFSPDVAMYRMDKIPPWLDVHNLAQLFMWMIRKRPDKDWSRAVDPRWVNYDPRLSERTILSIRALTASCSEQSVSPTNAREMITLVNQIFPSTLPDVPDTINISGIEEGRRRGLSVSTLARAEDSRIIESSFPIIAKTYKSLHEKLSSLFAAFGAAGIYVNKESDPDIDTFRVRLLAHDGIHLDQPLGHWEIGEDAENVFSFRIYINGLVPSRRSEAKPRGLRIPEGSSNPFWLHLLLRPSRSLLRGTFPSQTKTLTVADDGSLFLLDDESAELKATSIPSLVEMIKTWIEDSNVWEALHLFR